MLIMLKYKFSTTIVLLGFVVSVLCSVIPIQNNPQVTVQDGMLEGRTAFDKDGRIYYSFQGIPYAKPPLQELRFKAPQNPEPWKGVRSAKKEGNICPQLNDTTFHYFGEEDCLFLNVYTPKLPQIPDTDNTNEALLPVMVWIHGGSYIFNSGGEKYLGPQYLVTKDVIVVTLNYRLGSLGFLSFEDSSFGIPGNAGLKDQVAALKWVKRNIRSFGGDPDNVTIFGNSAGASSVHLQMLSPMSQGLFKRAVSQSGVAVAYWAFNNDKKFAHKLSANLGYNVTTDKDVLKLLMNCTAEDMINAEFPIKSDNFVGIGPVIEIPHKEYPEDHFLTKHPEIIIQENSYNNVPFIIGHTSLEMIYIQKYYEEEIPSTPCEVKKSIPDDIKSIVSETKLKVIAQKVIDHYYGKEGPSLEKWLNVMSDSDFVYPLHRTLKLMSKYTQPIYFYKFSLDADFNLGKWISNATLPGASHMDEIGYLFRFQGASELILGSKATLGVERMTTLWTNFAKTGDPQGNPPVTRWPTVHHNTTNLDYLEIGDELTVKQNSNTKNIDLWKDLYTYAQQSE